MHARFLVLLTGSLLLNGCATMNESECVSADWYAIGYEDGISGRSQQRIGDYRQDCAEYRVTPDLDAYLQGHHKGSEQYCTRDNGFRAGTQGAEYQNSCPESLAADFLLGFRDGRHLRAVELQIQSAQRQLDQAYTRLGELEQDISVRREELVADGLSREQRIGIRDDLEAMNTELEALIADIPFLQDDLDIARQNYAAVEASMSHYLRP